MPTELNIDRELAVVRDALESRPKWFGPARRALEDIADVFSRVSNLHALDHALADQREGLLDEAARALLSFEHHATTPDPVHGFATITSPEPWRASTRFLDRYYGGTSAARRALGAKPS